MDILLLGLTVVSLIVALVMSATAWRLMREEKQRSAARVAALSVAAEQDAPAPARSVAETFPSAPPEWKPKAPWAAPPSIPRPAQASAAASIRTATPAAELPLNEPRIEPVRISDPVVTHATGFLGAVDAPREDSGRQKSLAFAAAMLFVVLAGGLAWMMSGPEGTSAAAVGPNSPLELVSLTHSRQNQKLAVSGLVRNPDNGKPIERLSAVVFLFDRMGTFVTSSRASVDFLKLGAGDETPFVVSLDAPTTVARYRVSFRTDEGIVPHIDRRSASPAPAEGEQAVTVSAK